MALYLLHERSDRSPASPLFALEARAYLLQNDYALARNVLDRGLAESPAMANLGRVAELLWMMAQTAVQLDDWVTAEQALDQADLLAASMAKPLCRFQILTGFAQLLRTLEVPNQPKLSDVCAKLAEVFGQLDSQSLMFDTTLTRAALAVLGADYPNTFRRGIEIVGIGELDVSSQIALREELATVLGNTIPSKLDEAVLLAIEKSHQDQLLISKIAEIIAIQGYLLDAANLAGIEDYREPWEIETSPEVLL